MKDQSNVHTYNLKRHKKGKINYTKVQFEVFIIDDSMFQ